MKCPDRKLYEGVMFNVMGVTRGLVGEWVGGLVETIVTHHLNASPMGPCLRVINVHIFSLSMLFND